VIVLEFSFRTVVLIRELRMCLVLSWFIHKSNLRLFIHKPTMCANDILQKDSKWNCLIEVPGEYSVLGMILRYPSETLCLGCGLALDAHPLMSVEEVQEKYASSAVFRKGFDAMSKALSNSAERVLKQQSVTTSRGIDMEVYIKCAFVAESVFVTRFTSAAKMGATVVKLTSPEGGPRMPGVLMSLDAIPQDLNECEGGSGRARCPARQMQCFQDLQSRRCE
jgi:hypothetical protein